MHSVQESGIGVSGISGEVLRPRIRKRSVGRSAILVLPGDVKESTVVKEQSGVAGHGIDVTIGQLVVAREPLESRVVLSGLMLEVSRLIGLENDVDDASDRVR